MTSSFSARRAVVIVASTRAAAGIYPDRTGPLITQWLRERHWACEPPFVVSDGHAMAELLTQEVHKQPDLLITTGGTGLSADDCTSDITAGLVDREIPGFMEELRRRGSLHKKTALLSRGRAGMAGKTFVVNLPGSPGAVRDGLTLLDEVLEHLLEQVSPGSVAHEKEC